MALPILDGNQTSTTLATTVSGGAHYPNHIIASGTVTANTYTGQFVRVITTGNVGGNWLLERVSETFWKNKDDANEGATILYNSIDFRWEFLSGEGAAAWNGFTFNSIPPSDGWSDLVDIDTITVTPENPYRISGTVTIGNSVTIGSLPVQLSTTTIGGTARLNVTLSSATTIGTTAPSYGNLYGGSDGTNLRAILVDSSGRTTVTGSVNILGTSTVTFSAITGSVNLIGTSSVTFGQSSITGSVSILGTPSVTFSAIAGTVTANNPNGTLTTRFGSVVTANSVLATTCVTNASRKYLLVQNNQTGTSAGTVTIGIGFTPTTTQGIQLTAGAGLTFDSFVPTGAVYWLGATTGAAYTILEG